MLMMLCLCYVYVNDVIYLPMFVFILPVVGISNDLQMAPTVLSTSCTQKI